jgi:hypothetical protein
MAGKHSCGLRRIYHEWGVHWHCDPQAFVLFKMLQIYTHGVLSADTKIPENMALELRYDLSRMAKDHQRMSFLKQGPRLSPSSMMGPKLFYPDLTILEKPHANAANFCMEMRY